MIYLKPVNCENGLFVKLKDGQWVVLRNGYKVQADSLDPNFVDYAIRIGRLEEVNEAIQIEAENGS